MTIDALQWLAIAVLAGLVVFLLAMLGAICLAVMAGREEPKPWPLRKGYYADVPTKNELIAPFRRVREEKRDHR